MIQSLVEIRPPMGWVSVQMLDYALFDTESVGKSSFRETCRQADAARDRSEQLSSPSRLISSVLESENGECEDRQHAEHKVSLNLLPALNSH